MGANFVILNFYERKKYEGDKYTNKRLMRVSSCRLNLNEKQNEH